MLDFVYTANPVRIVFGPGALGRAAEEVARLGRRRTLVLAGPELVALGDRLEAVLADTVVGRFGGVAMHTPVEVTEVVMGLVRSVRPDCLVAVGGGSTTGLAKAIAMRTDLDQVVLPTTYAGSEVTPVLGETEHGRKTTHSSPAVLPETVIYDVELTRNLPVPITVTSAFNAMAHAVEALYAPGANPAIDAWAVRAIMLLGDGLRRLPARPADLEVRSDLLVGAWLAASCLGSVGMGLHHKLCHTLGGSFGLPHAATHTVVLPQAIAYNAPAAPRAMDQIAAALNAPDAATGVYDLITSLNGPVALRELGMAREDLRAAAELATSASYPNPRKPTPDGITQLLEAAWAGRRPSSIRPQFRRNGES
ncbi:MAG TPA: maleylacetate reductase [Pseudonocardia sp.]